MEFLPRVNRAGANLTHWWGGFAWLSHGVGSWEFFVFGSSFFVLRFSFIVRLSGFGDVHG